MTDAIEAEKSAPTHLGKEGDGASSSQLKIPADQVNIRLLLSNGKRADFLFPPSATIGHVKQHVFDNWPKDWSEERLESSSQIRLLYRGRFLEDGSVLQSQGLPAGQTTTLHMAPKPAVANKGQGCLLGVFRNFTSRMTQQDPLFATRKIKFSLEQDYVYQTEFLPSRPYILASASNQQMKLYDASTLQIISSWPAHAAGQISQFATRKGADNDALLVSCGTDAHIAVWDLRCAPSATPSMLMVDESRMDPLLSVSINASLTAVAAGTELVVEDARVNIWDLRMAGKTMGTLVESFADDVTQCKFHPQHDNILATGSTDGLACIFDTNQMENEDDALLSVINSGSSVNRIGYFGPAGEYLYLCTHIETLSLWSLAQGKKLADFGDVRTHAMPEGAIEYVIDCAYEPSSQRLCLFAGSHAGDIYQLDVSLSSLQSYRKLSGGHSATVRTLDWDVDGGRILTGAEDASLVMWTGDQPSSPCRTDQADAKMQNKRNSSQYRPY